MAVSKPRPNSTPTGYIFQGVSIALGVAAEEPVHQAAVVRAGAPVPRRRTCLDRISRNTLTMRDRTMRFSTAIRYRKVPGHGGADDAGPVVQPRAAVFDLAVERADAEVQQHGQEEDDRGVAEGEEVADAERALAVVDQLAGGVVDGGDVVGVEGVAHAQGVGQHAGPEAEDLVRADVVVAADGRRQHGPAEHVEADDQPGHGSGPGPFAGGKPVPDPRQPCAWISHQGPSWRSLSYAGSLEVLQLSCNNGSCVAAYR